MTIVTANDLKIKGISGIEEILQDEQEVIISVRGKPSYVVMDLAQYEFLRECELETAWLQTRNNIEDGQVRRESAQEHITRIKAELDNAL